MARHQAAAFLFSTLLIGSVCAITSEAPAAHAQASLSVDEILDRMQRHEANQSRELEHYEAIRHYQVQYRGFGTLIAAKMDVRISFDSLSGKSFRILSQSGSKLLCNKVLKRAVDSEEEASKDRASTALNTANYRFRLIGTEMLEGEPTYILQVDPLKKSKFLYLGKIWVDAVDFAVVKIEAEPAQNPSALISETRIEYTNSKTHSVWLPEKSTSQSKIRIGGTAVLTIDYGTYVVTLSGGTNQP